MIVEESPLFREKREAALIVIEKPKIQLAKVLRKVSSRGYGVFLISRCSKKEEEATAH